MEEMEEMEEMTPVCQLRGKSDVLPNLKFFLLLRGERRSKTQTFTLLTRLE